MCFSSCGVRWDTLLSHLPEKPSFPVRFDLVSVDMSLRLKPLQTNQ